MSTLMDTSSTIRRLGGQEALTERFTGMELARTGKQLVLPMVGILVFLGFWHLAAPQVNTSLGSFPGPVQVWEQSGQLWQEHINQRERADKFVTMQEERNARILAEDPNAKVKIRGYPGAPTFLDQIATSL